MLASRREVAEELPLHAGMVTGYALERCAGACAAGDALIRPLPRTRSGCGVLMATLEEFKALRAGSPLRCKPSCMA